MRYPVLRFLTVGWLAFAGVVAARAQPLVSVPRVSHPALGETMYFVLTDRFANGDPANDRAGSVSSDRDDHGFDPTAVQFYHGGDFAGLTQRLDYLEGLGVTAIWVTPPFRNKWVQGNPGSRSAGYHGYWILDYLNIDPHLGGNAAFRAFVEAAQARGLKVLLDIVTNHTADVIFYPGGGSAYRGKAAYPYRTSAGATFDDRAYAYNGYGGTPAFPELTAAGSFPYVPTTTPAEAGGKNPAWLNDLTNYHNRGESTFAGESSVYGDFIGLDDVFTEKPAVVEGFIDVFSSWITDYGIDGFRIDTVKHVNLEFWQAFGPAMRATAAGAGRSHFLQFGEVFSGDPRLLSEFSTLGGLDATLDFGFAFAARDWVSRGQSAANLEALFAQDDLYTDHDSNVHSTETFLGNHDIGRFGGFLRADNGVSDATLVDLMELGHGLMYLVRGQPVLYYGDEQGMVGNGGDTGAREDMFASQTQAYQSLGRLGTAARGGVDKYDAAHPLYRTLARLAALRAEHPALARGAMHVRPSGRSNVFAFSRIERGELVEYLVALNNSRQTAAQLALATAQPAGATLRRVFDSRTPDDAGNEVLTAGADGRVSVVLQPLQFAVWRAEAALPAPATGPTIAFASPAAGATLTFSALSGDGQTFPSRTEIRADVAGGDGVGEVTFVLERSSRPGEYEVLGTDDAPPYRVYWRPPADLPAGEAFTLIATVDNLRGGRAAAQRTGLRVAAPPAGLSYGVRGATGPRLTTVPAATTVSAGGEAVLRVTAAGSEPLAYQWFKDGHELVGATAAELELSDAGESTAGQYAVRVSNLAGAVVSAPVTVTVTTAALSIDLPPESATVAPGGQVSFTVEASGPEPLAYQWRRDGAAVPGATGATLTLTNLSGGDAGDYTVAVSAGGATVVSEAARLLVAEPVPGGLVNLSVRTRAGGGDETLIAGFVVAGGAADVLVRAVGPTLAEYEVPGVLADPNLSLNADEVVVAANDDWQQAGGVTPADFDAVGAFALLDGGADAALRARVDGARTAVVGGGTGVALVEVYALPGADGRLVNISARSEVGEGADVLILGFVLNGNVPRRLLIRAVGPTLARYELEGVLVDPVLELYRGDTLIATNDDWSGDDGRAVGAFELTEGSRDAVLVRTLPPDAGEGYTAVVRGANGGTGVALVEIYALP